MPLQVIAPKVPRYAAYKYAGTQADVATFNSYLGPSGWTATHIDATSYQLTGPLGTWTLSTADVAVFRQDLNSGSVVIAAIYPDMATAQKYFE
jgi:hypothetical protein